MNRLIKSVLTAFSMSLTSPINATVIDTGAGIDSGGGATLLGMSQGSPNYQSIAGRFSLLAPEQITSVEGWMNWYFFPGFLTLSVFSTFNELPGSALFSATVRVAETPWSHPDWRGTGGLAWSLVAGDYWLVFSVPNDQLAYGSMPHGGLERPLKQYAVDYQAISGFSTTDGQFGMRIRASPIPEPSSVLLVLLGSILLGFSKRYSNRRKRY